MNDKNLLDRYCNKRVIIFLRNPAGFIFRGMFISYNDTHVVIDDIKKGNIAIAMTDISTIEMNEGFNDTN